MYVVISYYTSEGGAPTIMPLHDTRELAVYLVKLMHSGQEVQVFQVMPDNRYFWHSIASNMWETPVEADAGEQDECDSFTLKQFKSRRAPLKDEPLTDARSTHPAPTGLE